MYIYSHPRAHITAASMKKSPLGDSSVNKFSENMRIGQDESMQHFDRCHLMMGNGDLQIEELPNIIHIPPEYPYKIQDDSGIAIRQSLRHFVEKIFPDINGNFHAPEQHWIFG